MGDIKFSAPIWRLRLTRNLSSLLVLYYLIYNKWKNELCYSMGIYTQHDFGVIKMTNGYPVQESDIFNFITFIIPSTGRDSIEQTICSLFNQTHNLWRAVIVFDGEPQQLTSATLRYLSDPRIRNCTIPKMGESNFAATLRNYRMSRDDFSEWFAFVDDDDTLSPDYITRLVEETRLNTMVEAVVFRMSGHYVDGPHVFPPQEDVMFQINRVGISFAIKRRLFEAGLWFQPSSGEDFTLLERVFHANTKMVISPYVTYYVKNVWPADPSVDYPRHYIN
jgi:glycosyltransferase involved in cell wall biosynthesis